MHFVYLDQNKWIDLAKAESGRPDGERFVPVLAAAREAVNAGRAIFPISATHIKETALAPRVDQRQKLAVLLTELSRGVVIRTPRPIVEHGMRQVLRKFFGLSPLEEKVRVFGRGLEEAFGFHLADIMPGRSTEQIERLRDRIDSPDAWIDHLAQHDEESRNATVGRMTDISSSFAAGRQDDRALLSDNNRAEVRRAFAARVALHFYDRLREFLAELGKSVEDWGSLGPDKLIDFWHGIPCVRVLLELEECLHFDRSKAWNANDLHDLEFLSLAIPHCDVVVAEKYWIHHAKQRKLDIAFGTKLITDLAKLEELIMA